MFETIVNVIAASGYLGVFLLMFLENVFPPIPSELIMPFAGFAAARGDLNLMIVIAAGTAGSVVGALPWYYAGLLLGKDRLSNLADRYGKWMTVTPEDIETASSWFAKHGRGAVFFGRLVPAVRTLISVPAGITRMPLKQLLLFSLSGSLIWTGALAIGGFYLESKYSTIARYLDPATKAIVAIIAGAYLYRLVRQLAKEN
ncbi:DedA family protein [Noviherbaspirillum malthae]|jgi:membrane protein DedA with SNARE-associated domain|uniref:DedA family protein n=1 Tax=Noviherbaspirillum malthae TaxID=1260987 RepID=UPI00188ED1DF|nr:DedA family protein [Noviherbaspirillum malthae]